VLEVEALGAVHRGRHTTVVAAADVSFVLRAGESVALVGESGSGKTTIARTIAGLHPIASGEVRLDGELLAASVRDRTREQQRRIQFLFQNATEALNPRQRIVDAVARPARVLRGLSKSYAAAEAAALIERVRLPASVIDRYPLELSGGERQRVGIARALAADPDVLICDEITSALDVSVQAAVIELLLELRREFGLSLLFITHDLGVVRLVGDSVLVLAHGTVCDRGSTDRQLSESTHPYTRQLMEAAPSLSTTFASALQPASIKGASSDPGR